MRNIVRYVIWCYAFSCRSHRETIQEQNIKMENKRSFDSCAMASWDYEQYLYKKETFVSNSFGAADFKP